MKKEILSFLLIFSILIFIPYIKGDLLISCPSYNINTTAYSDYKINCTFNNTYNFEIVNLNIYNTSNIITMQDINIPSMTSVNKELNFKTNNSGNYNITATFYFYYYVNTTVTPENKNVDIYNFEFRPSLLEVTQGSLVTFINKDSYNVHSVVDQGGEFSSSDINPNQSWSYTFNTIKNYTIRDGWVYGNYMFLRVKSSNELILTHNNNYDKSIIFNINSSYIPTTLNINILTPYFETEWNQSQEGVLSITNNGSNIAKNIKLLGEWVSFSKNNFDLNPGQTTYINMEIIPYITNTIETNKTYNKTINISSDNTLTYYNNYTIFINYSSTVTTPLNTTDWVKYFYYKKEFCEKSNWTAPDCRTEPIIEYVPTYNCSDMEINITTTIAEWQRYRTMLSELTTNLGDDVQTQKELNDIINMSYVDLINMSRENLKLNKENSELSRNNTVMQIAIGMILFTMIVGSGLLIHALKKQKKLKYESLYNVKNDKYYKNE